MVPRIAPRPAVAAPVEHPSGSEVRATRAISAIAAVVYPLFWWIHGMGDAVRLDPLSLRLIVSTYALGIVVLSYLEPLQRRWLRPALIGLIYLLTIHFFVLLTMNDLHWELVIGVLLILIGMNAGSSLGFRTRHSLNAYLATVATATGVTAILVEDPVVPLPLFVAAMLVAVGTSFFGIGAHLKSRSALVESRRRLQTVLTGAPILFWSTDRAGRLTVVEGKGLEPLDVDPAEVRGEPLAALFTPGRRLETATRRALEGEPTPATVKRSGRVFETWHAPLRDPAGEILGTVGVGTDVTTVHRMGRQLRQAQKMEAIGQLAGGIAHDFNNILTAILGYAQLAKSSHEGDGVVAESLEEIRTASERAAALVRQLLAFSSRQALEARHVDLNDLVRSMSSMLQPLIGEDLILVTRLEEDLPGVHADPTGLEQIVMNLAVNARDACPEGGTLTIGTRRAEVTEADAPAALVPGPHVILEVDDDGSGMDAETRERIFEPFFTTKPFGRGSGLGLATVYGIVEQTGGAIEVDSEPGRGSRFIVWLPVDPAIRPVA